MSAPRLIALSLLVATVFMLTACSGDGPSPTPTPSNRADGRLFAQVGRGELFDKVAASLFAEGADVQRVDEVSEIEIEPGLTLLFDGEWLLERQETPELQAFLISAIEADLAIVMVGGQTFQLYSVVAKAEILTEGYAGNTVGTPAYSEAPVAGVRVKHRENRPPSHSRFASNGTTVRSFTDGILQWQDHYSQYDS